MKIKSYTFKRLSKSILKEKLIQGQSFLLMGPRQTGKSTLIESIFDELPSENQLRYYFQLPQTRENFELNPEQLIQEVEIKYQNKPVYLFIDEIQKIPVILDVLQFLIDHQKIILVGCGSSARQMRKLKANWLPGRVHLIHLTPLTWNEMKNASSKVNLEDVLIYGGLPGILSQKDIPQRIENLNAYTHLYLEEEIRSEAVTRNLPRFTKFLRLGALESGTAPNFSKIASQVGVSAPVIKEYYQILIDTLIIHELKAFGTNRDAVLKKSKYYFFDIGVRNAAANLPLEKNLLTLQKGILFEHFVFLELWSHFHQKYDFSYFRTKSGIEVDFILETGQKRIAIECKSTHKPSQKDVKGLNYLKQNFKVDQTILVCQISNPQKIDDHICLSWRDLISYLKS